ncbi:MAG TPA: DUF4279 domain-containing protein [Bryobacteraceae bacterium]|nr:DUF4279 domain-containing protein [Bryobacteraceae bacterium]
MDALELPGDTELDMNDKDNNEQSQHLRATDEQAMEKIYFPYSASLRIFGIIPDLEEITQHLGIAPTRVCRHGEARHAGSPPYEYDMWMYTACVPENEPLHVHIDALWSVFGEREQYLLQLKQNLKVDVFLGYRSNCDHAGLEVPYDSLQMFVELQVPLGLSVIVI